MNAESKVRRIFDESEIEINGPNRCDIQIRDPRFYNRLMSDGSPRTG